MFDYDEEQTPVIKVIGIGECGGNITNTMIVRNIKGVDFIAANTDALQLKYSSAPTKIQLGMNTVEGLAAGLNPETGREAARDSLKEIEESINGSDMVILVASVTNGTEIWATQMIAEVCQAIGVFTIGVVTMPFAQEGKHRTITAGKGFCELGKLVDSLIIIPADSLSASYEIMIDAVRGITDLIPRNGFGGIDVAELKHILCSDSPVALGVGEGSGEGRALKAVQRAMIPLMDVDITHAKGILVNIAGSHDMSVDEYNTIRDAIHIMAKDDAYVVMGVTLDELLNKDEKLKVTAYYSNY